MKKIFSSIFIIAVSTISLEAQLIVTTPEFPVIDEPVTIVFDATKGNAGLASYTGEVYAHTGVLTTTSTSTADWKHVKTDWGVNTAETKMTKIGDHTYQLEIGPSIKEYYGISDGEKVTDLAFVFRSAEPYSGTTYYEGKDVGNKDIFYPVYEAGLSVSISKPAKQTLIQSNSTILFSASCSKSATLHLYRNSTLVTTTTGTSIAYAFDFPTTGDYWLKVTAETPDESAADSVFVGVIGDQPVATIPSGMKDGINYLSSNSVCLVLYAPGKQSVFLTGDFNDWTPYSEFRAYQDGDRYWLTISGLIPGKEYAYQYLVDGNLKIADPYTHKVLDPWNDQWIPDTVYPNLKPYPQGLTTGIVSIFQTGQQSYQWQNTDFVPPPADDLVIYELLVRDFIAAHDWQTLADTLGYFTRLGINAIEVMPFNEFEGNESWGYNPSFYFAPDKYYGPEHDLKAFIDSCHGRGIAVIQDLVLNHSYGQSPLVQLYFDSATNQVSADNPWYNQTSPNPYFSWGYDFNHESRQTKVFVDRVNRYWMENFNIDGYRFDFTKGFTNTPGDGSFLDPSRITILERMADSIWTVKPDQYIILEHFAPNTEEIQLSDFGMMLWDKENCTYNQCTMGFPSGPDCSWNIGGISYLNRG
ncbi:MAG TPA: alpha-amylase family glycosyl hydrolase, partial [Bacteroidales bacterium]|nr:alpha-amylase family glycosyl hydrolase [Bacteroidales bacterium]